MRVGCSVMFKLPMSWVTSQTAFSLMEALAACVHTDGISWVICIEIRGIPKLLEVSITALSCGADVLYVLRGTFLYILVSTWDRCAIPTWWSMSQFLILWLIVFPILRTRLPSFLEVCRSPVIRTGEAFQILTNGRQHSIIRDRRRMLTSTFARVT